MNDVPHAKVRDLPLQRAAEGTLAGDHPMKLRDSGSGTGGRADQGLVTFVVDEGGGVDGERDIQREAEALPDGGVSVSVGANLIRVDAVGNDGDITRIHAIGNKNLDRKSTRLNSSHPSISYAVFCLKKKKINP